MITHPAALASWRQKRAALFKAKFAPAPRLSIDEWADQYRYLSSVNSSESGRWRTDRVPWVRGILAAIRDPGILRVVIQKPAQVSYTEGIIGNVIGYNVHLRPRSMVVVQPSNDDAKDWSKDKLANLIESTPVLQARMRDVDLGRQSNNTILVKAYPGGLLKIVGGTSPKNLRRTSAGWILIDEVDGLPPSAGKEGDPVDIVLKRGTTFEDAKQIIGSTPTNAQSRIVRAVKNCHAVFDFKVPCPHCGAMQTLAWGGKDTPFGIKFEYDEIDHSRRVRAGSVFYECSGCHAAIEEESKYEMTAAGDWLTADGVSLIDYLARDDNGDTVGFRVGTSLISPFPACSWEKLVQEWLDAQGDPSRLMVFFNTRLGLPWNEFEGEISTDALAKRAENYGADVPDGAGVLTLACDVQGDRLEVAIYGWGVRLESWLIAHHRINGDPEQQEVWQQLEAIRMRAYRNVHGHAMRVAVSFVDAGYLPQSVYRYVKGRETSQVYAIKGVEGRSGEPLRRVQKANKFGVKPWTISVDSFKDSLFRRLRVAQPGGGYIHFCAPNDAGTPDAEFFAQFGREVLVTDRSQGMARRRYKKTGRNEAVDLSAYAHAALLTIPNVREQLGALADAVRQKPGKAGEAPARGARRRMISRGIR